MKIIKTFFLTLGVIFFLLIMLGIYLWVADPFGLKPLLKAFSQPLNVSGQSLDDSIGNQPSLTPEQEATLENYGINPATLPTTLTPEMEACFIEKLGTARVNEIKAGDEPGAMDFIKAGACLK